MSVPADTNPADGSSRSSVRSLHAQARYTRWFRWHLLASVAVFFASAFAGYAVLGAFPLDQLMELAPEESPLPVENITFLTIMFNNLRVLLLILLGTLSAGALSLFILFTNGAIVGAVVAVFVQQWSWLVVFAALAPHGVLELSAFFMAAAIGLRVPHRVVRYLLGWDDRPLTRVEGFELAVLAALLALMIIVAAWVEIYVTPDVIRWAGGPSVDIG